MIFASHCLKFLEKDQDWSLFMIPVARAPRNYVYGYYNNILRAHDFNACAQSAIMMMYFAMYLM